MVMHRQLLLLLTSTVTLLHISAAAGAEQHSSSAYVWTAGQLADGIKEVDRQCLAEYAKEHAAGLTVGIVSGPTLVWSKSYGDADVERRLAANRDTVYRIGSITKEFTALMLLQLVERGTVNLSDPVAKYVPEVNQIPSAYPKSPGITLIQLATHYSGLNQEPDDLDRFTTGPVEDWEHTLLLAFTKLKYVSEPGTHFLYSNIGYAILGLALRRAAGEPYTKYVERHILRPLSMAHTRFQPDTAMLPTLAKGYVLHDGLVDPATPRKELLAGRGYKVPNGALFTTVGDLSRFMAFQLGYGSDRVLSRSALLKSQSEIFWAQQDAKLGYGIGMMLVRQGDTVALGHGGAVAGFLAGEYFDPTTHVGIIFLRNAEGHGFEPEFVVRLLAILNSHAHKGTH